MNELAEIDNDNSGSIDRFEWLKYLSCEDPKTHTAVFRSELKKMFEKADTDGSGTLEIKELRIKSR
jgi:Ca2+-binding EF-hand superfamily protein